MTSEGPFAVGSALWRDARGRLVCTLVAKTTLALFKLAAEVVVVGSAFTADYLPDTVATSRSLLLSYPVMALCESRLREDLAEPQAKALFAMALGRVLHSRAEG
jgi:hypothetical protein